MTYRIRGRSEEDVKQALDEVGGRLVSKEAVSWMRVLGFLAKLIGNKYFMDDYWTTIGKTIYYPTSVQPKDIYKHYDVIYHEIVHIKQWKKWGLLFSVSYMLLPVPFFFAWFRWRWEREAYMETLRYTYRPLAHMRFIVRVLWEEYGWTWPKRWMMKWFKKEVKKEGIIDQDYEFEFDL